MDLDAFAADRQPEWDRLGALAARSRLSGAEADELIERYQSAAGDLSAVQSTSGRTTLGDQLSLRLARARLRFAGARGNVVAAFVTFFVLQLPAALYRIRWLSLAVTLAFIAIATAFAAWASSEPAYLAAMASETQLEQYAKEDFVAYYSDHSEGTFMSMVWANNAWLATQGIAFGIVGVYTPYMLLSNAKGLGEAAAVMDAYDRLDVFFAFILPHGQLELYALFVSVAAGLTIFWAWVAPGPRTRLQSLGAAGRSMITVVVGLVLALGLSGFVEGFITRQPWDPILKIGIGTLALVIFLAYQWILGRYATLAGETGDLSEFEAGATRVTAG